MKREEMILRIMEMLVELPEDVEEAANDLLNRIEKAGMKPPGREEDLLTFKTMAGVVTGTDYSRYVWDEDVAEEKPDERAFWDEDSKKSGAW